MTENKRFTLKGLVEGVPNIADKGEIIEQEDAIRLLNEQEERIQELEKELKNHKKLNNILEGFLLNRGYDFNDILKFLQDRTER